MADYASRDKQSREHQAEPKAGKGTVESISSVHPFIEWHVRFTKTPLKLGLINKLLSSSETMEFT